MPQYVHTYVFCEDSVGSVSWMGSDGAESYTAVAVGQDSDTHMCITNSTICTWTDLHCGDIYTVHVIANDYLCNSMPSNGTIIHMGTVAVTSPWRLGHPQFTCWHWVLYLQYMY